MGSLTTTIIMIAIGYIAYELIRAKKKKDQEFFDQNEREFLKKKRGVKK